jgi:hypothetical protein
MTEPYPTVNTIITWASGTMFCRSRGFQAFVKSLVSIWETDVHFFTHEMPDDVRLQLEELGYFVHLVEEDVRFITRDRFYHYWKFLLGKNYKYVLAVDCKDVVFQDSPFFWLEDRVSVLDRFVYLISEGMVHRQSGWNLIEQFEFQKNVMGFLWECRPDPVLNGGVMLGTQEDLANLFFMIWSVSIRNIGNCTDQAGLNYLYHFLKNDQKYKIACPHEENFCITGEAIKEGYISPEVRDGIFYNSTSKKPYYLVHQYDRTVYLEDVFSRYLK